MKVSLLIILALAIVSIPSLSCSKSNSTTSTPPTIYGLWTGTYLVNGVARPPQYYSLIIKTDGTCVNETMGDGQQHFSPGNWTLVKDTLTCITTCVYGLPSNIGVTQKHTAVFNSTQGTLTLGVWQNYPTPTGTGTFTLTKVK
ncbi:MAG: hypothetical protein KGO82_15525 [Bacteroidota bacterium]|nr:hypothetical protein [Bacteroidota bacterium]